MGTSKMHVQLHIAALAVLISATRAKWNSEQIKWETDLDTFKEKVYKSRKPGFMLITKSWCQACTRLEELLPQNHDLPRLSENFIMLRLEDDQEPKHERYRPDGGYIPRLF